MEIDTTPAARLRWGLLRRGDRVSAAVWAAVFLICLISSVRLPFGDLSIPGPGVWPSLLAAVGLVGSAALFIRGRDIPVLARDQSGRRLGLYMAAIVLYAPLYSLVGFLPASALVLVVLIRVAGRFSWLATMLSAVIGPIAVFAIFGLGLDVPIEPF